MVFEEKNLKSVEVSDSRILLPQEIEDIVAIVDIGPKHLDKVTPENLNEIIDRQVDNFIKKREKVNNFDGEALSEIFEKILNRSSASHAIQCTVNMTEDWKALNKYVASFVEDNNLDEEKKNAAAMVSSFINRQVEMKGLLTNLYKIDIWRRIGKEKNDKKYWEKARIALAEEKENIENTLVEYEEANRYNSREDLSGKIESIRRLVNGDVVGDLEKNFYTGICQNLSALIFREEEFNEEKIKEAFDILEK